VIPFNTVMELLNISNQFMLERMKETLEDLLLRQYLDYDNFVSLLITAENYSCHNLKRQLFEFARRHFIAILLGNVAKDLIDHPDHAYLLDDLDYFVQSGKLRDVDDEDDQEDDEAASAAAEHQQAEVDELLTYFSEEEIQHQKEMEAFWERERQIDKEREKQKANEQRRRAAKAHAKSAAKARRNKVVRPVASKAPSDKAKGKEKDNDTSVEDEVAAPPTEDPRRLQLQASVEAANKALAKDYAGNEEAVRIVKRLRAVKKKLSQIDNLLEKKNKVNYPCLHLSLSLSRASPSVPNN
jgi:hypothetical protein